ncbi:MAG TPA: energy-coupling factor ABC transporter permease [Anaerolineae bacterium]|nr:energy-coupling factor ABC transporter permease [Anaerolineae bacterium]HQI86699.1 energy-coupling factor ABC transporter permease [Anaerolineae bacterium]
MLFSPVPMHIPDGFLSVGVALVLWLIAIVVVGYALKRVNADVGERQVPLMGVLAACIFAGQMLNFSVTGGTSGHLMGAALATILLGPWAAILVMTCVVGVQALIFQDGGLLALGANIVNMGVIGVTVAYFVQRTLRKFLGNKSGGLFASGFLSGWLSIVAAALACALQLALSGSSPANIAIPAMAGIHALIGVGEGLITAGALVFIKAARRDLLEAERTQVVGGKAVWIGGLVIAVALAIISPRASTHPDGLEWVAEQRGFLDLAQGPLFEIIPDYVLPGVANESLATILAGVIGALIVFGAAAGVAYLRRSRAQSSGA